MLTRSAARRAAVEREGPFVLVSPSATGYGVHTRWFYPTATPATPNAPKASLSSDGTNTVSSSSTASSDSSFSGSPSSIFDSSFSSSSHSSQYIDPPETQTLALDSPRPLRRTPRHPWVEEGGSTRLVLTPDSFTPESIEMRESMLERKLEDIFITQYHVMMEERELAYQALADEGRGKDESDIEAEYAEGEEFRREDTEPLEDMDVLPDLPNLERPHRGQPLGPHGTEIIPDNFVPAPSGLPHYPKEWLMFAHTLEPQPTENIIR